MPGIVWLCLFFIAPMYVVLAILFGGVDPILRQPVPVWNPLHWDFSQFNYVMDAIGRMRAGGYRWIDLRPAVQEAWAREMAARSVDTVWASGGCSSWYLNGKGENTNNWPGPWLEYRRRTRKINPADYRVAI